MTVKTNRFSDPKAQRRLFVLLQAAKAGIGVALGLAFFGMVGRPDVAELAAFLGLMVPGLLALLALTPISLCFLEQVGLASFAALIGFLAVLTGGVVSPLVVWFALVPAEAALTGGRPAVLRAGIAAGAALLAVGGIEAMGMLPASRLVFPGALPLWAVYGCSMLAALVQAVLIAAAAQDRQRAADAAAAEGAAMYRFLADNAMDLITRHSSDGRIRFASPATSALLGRLPDEIVGLALPSAGASRRHECGAGGLDGVQLSRAFRYGRSPAASPRRPFRLDGNSLPPGADGPGRTRRYRGGDARYFRAQGP